MSANTEHPTTTEDYNALAALLGARSSALDAEARVIASQKALAKAQSPEDAGAQQLAAITQAAGIAAQKKAISDNQAAILKNTFSVPDSGYAGQVIAGDKAGGVESALLAARAIKLATKKIIEKIGVEAGSSIVLYSLADLPDFQSLITFRVQSRTLDQALNDALQQLDVLQAEVGKFLGPQIEFVSPALVGAGFEAANKLLGYFRSDYTIQGVVVNTDESLLVNALAEELVGKKVKVIIPAVYNSAAVFGDSDILALLNGLAVKRIALQQKIDLAQTTVDSATAAAGKESDPAKKAQLVSSCAKLKIAADQGKSSAAMYDGLLSKLSTPDDKSKLPLAAIIQQDAVRRALQGGSNLLVTRISSVGGAYYTRKNLWSFFGTMPFFTMGGAVVHYSLFDGNNGIVLSAGVVPYDGGFVKVSKLPKLLNDCQ